MEISNSNQFTSQRLVSDYLFGHLDASLDHPEVFLPQMNHSDYSPEAVSSRFLYYVDQISSGHIEGSDLGGAKKLFNTTRDSIIDSKEQITTVLKHLSVYSSELASSVERTFELIAAGVDRLERRVTSSIQTSH